MIPLAMDKLNIRRDHDMGNPKRDSRHYRPTHLGTQPRKSDANKGAKMQDTSGEHAQVIQTKGE